MDDPVLWIILAVFYAPLHFMLPVLFLFIVGGESEGAKKSLVRGALIDAGVSMGVAFVIAALLINNGYIALAMVALMLFLLVPIIRIVVKRRSMKAG